jgi:succinyl-diaminopimelate desuccinylase
MLKDVLTHLDEKYTINLLQNMVRINSVVGKEAELAYFIQTELDKIGLKSVIHEIEPNRCNIYATIHETDDGKGLNFNGHLDTIPVVDGWDTDPFSPVISDEKLYGLGACDMKGGIACMLNAIRAIILSEHELKGKMFFSAVIDEEALGKGAKLMLTTKYADVDTFIIAEPATGEKISSIPIGITGKILYDIYIRGKASHGFFPESGINAIDEAAKIINNLEKLEFLHHPDFGTGNICTLKVEGGYEKYSVVVPENARFEVNRLLVPGETVSSAIADMKKLISSLNLRAKVDIKIKPPQYEPFVMEKSDQIIQLFDSVYADTFQRAPTYGYSKGITDANIYMTKKNTKCINFGPKGEGIHQKNESVYLDWLPKASEIYAKLAVLYLK